MRCVYVCVCVVRCVFTTCSVCSHMLPNITKLRICPPSPTLHKSIKPLSHSRFIQSLPVAHAQVLTPLLVLFIRTEGRTQPYEAYSELMEFKMILVTF